MKTTIPSSCSKGRFIRTNLIALAALLLLQQRASSQCTAAQLNWDNMDFLSSTSAAYTSFYPAATFPYTQNFAIGPRKLNFSWNNTANVALNGENATNTGHAGSFSTAGEDVQFTTSTSAARNIIMDFDVDVSNVQFSMFDVDNAQVLTITAVNAASTAQNITVTKANAGSTIVIAGSGTPVVTVTGLAGDAANNSNNGTINISIAGPVKTITVSMTAASGDIWLGDIDACVTGSFPTDYFVGLQPYTGQPTYVIGTSDTNTVSLINVATGQAKMIFQDASSPRYINGLGYDHLRHELYYVIDFTATPANNMTLKKYNFETNVISTVVADIRTIGIPTFQRGVESAGCAFYDGALYFGIEGNGSASRENIIWRIDFDGSGNITGTRQVYSKTTTAHDWGDFALIDGMLYDFNSGAGTPQYAHYNLQSGAVVNSYTSGFGAANPIPRQTGITWNDQLYWVYDSIALYNFNGTISPRTDIVGATVLDWTGFCGDATGFRPKSDFGDAPTTYDPVALSPALHMQDTALRLGPTFDQEFDKVGSGPLANADGADEDAIATVNVLDTATTNYLADITVYNNTGADATLIGWLDINGNGVFEAGEGRTITVPNGGPTLQTVTMSWVGINTPLAWAQWTYLRIRLTRASNGMTTSNSTGYFADGEVEDYLIWTVNTLPAKIISFDAEAVNNNSVKVSWTSENESMLNGYEVQRSTNGNDWTTVSIVFARNAAGAQNYIAWDMSPYKGKSYYRLKINEKNGAFTYTPVRSIFIRVDQIMMVVYPNPVTDQTVVRIIAEQPLDAIVRVFNSTGAELSNKKVNIAAGETKLPLNTDNYPSGIYFIRVETQFDIKTTRFVKK